LKGVARCKVTMLQASFLKYLQTRSGLRTGDWEVYSDCKNSALHMNEIVHFTRFEAKVGEGCGIKPYTLH
jgi:hypothetical protein